MPFFFDLESIVPLLISFGMIVTRLGFMFITAPALSAESVPRRFLTGAIFAISVTVYLGLPEVPLLSVNMLDIAIATMGEAAVGSAAGLTARIVFTVVETAGQVLGVPMGMGFSQSIDPLSNNQSVVTSRLLGLIMSMVFFALDIHLVMIKSIIESFLIMPPGKVVLSGGVGYVLAHKASMIFSSAISLAAPVLVVLLGVMVSLGMMARVSPKVNLFVLSFAISVGVGIIALKAAIPNIVAFTRTLALRIEPLVSDVIVSF